MCMRILVLLSFFILSGCAADKFGHAVVGAGSHGFDNKCYLALALGVGKELVDSRTHEPDVMDAAATYLGCWAFKIEF